MAASGQGEQVFGERPFGGLERIGVVDWMEARNAAKVGQQLIVVRASLDRRGSRVLRMLEGSSCF